MQSAIVKNRRELLGAALGFMALYLAWLLWGRSDPWEHYLVGDLMMLFTSLLAAVLAIWARGRIENPALCRAWTWIASGLVLLALDDLARMLYQGLSPNRKFLPSPVEGIYLVGALLLWIGLLVYPRRPRQRFGRLSLLFDLTLVSAGALTLVWMIVIEPILPGLPKGPAGLLVLLYPLADLFTLILLINLFLLSEAQYLPVPWAWIIFGLLAYIFSDLSYSSLLMQGGYQSGTPVDVGWVLGDGLVLLGILAQANHPADERGGTPRLFIQRSLMRLQSLMPLLMVVIIGWYSLLAWQIAGRLDVLGLWVTLVLGLGLIARQGIVTGEVEMQQYANLVNSVAEPAFVCDTHGTLRLVNPALLSAAGYSASQDLLGRPLQQLLHPADGTSQMVGLGLSSGWSGELHLRRSNGTLIPISLALRPILPGRGSTLALAGTAHDLSEVKRQQADLQAAYEQIAHDRSLLERMNNQLEQRVEEKTASLTEALEQLEQQNQMLQELDRLKSEFVSLVSHELRAPLTNISGGIELLQGGSYRLPARVRANLDLVRAEIQRLSRFVETILDLSALDAGRMPFYPAPLALSRVTHALSEQLQHTPNGERVAWDIPGNLPVVMADEQALHSIFFHLLDNAFKYAPEGRILVSAHPDGCGLVVQIEDEGPGLAQEAIPLLFDRFYRQNSNDAQMVYGHGLGLYIVRRLLESMGGEIHAANRPQGGACFTFRLVCVEGRGEYDAS